MIRIKYKHVKTYQGRKWYEYVWMDTTSLMYKWFGIESWHKVLANDYTNEPVLIKSASLHERLLYSVYKTTGNESEKLKEWFNA